MDSLRIGDGDAAWGASEQIGRRSAVGKSEDHIRPVQQNAFEIPTGGQDAQFRKIQQGLHSRAPGQNTQFFSQMLNHPNGRASDPTVISIRWRSEGITLGMAVKPRSMIVSGGCSMGSFFNLWTASASRRQYIS